MRLLNEPLKLTRLGPLNAVSARPDFLRQADIMRNRYITDRATYERIAADKVLPSYLLYSDFDFQILLLEQFDAVADAITAYEAANGLRFDTIFTLDFTNPVAWILKRNAPRLVAIVADPYRAVRCRVLPCSMPSGEPIWCSCPPARNQCPHAPAGDLQGGPQQPPAHHADALLRRLHPQRPVAVGHHRGLERVRPSSKREPPSRLFLTQFRTQNRFVILLEWLRGRLIRPARAAAFGE